MRFRKEHIIPGMNRNMNISMSRQRSGEEGQYTLLYHPFTFISDPRDLANGKFGIPDFLWVAGDGNTPTIGPALTLTGTPSIHDSPWQDLSGSAVEEEIHTGSSYRKTTTPVDPGLTDDIVLVAIIRQSPDGNSLPAWSRWISTYNTRGLNLLSATAPTIFTFYLYGDTTVARNCSVNYTLSGYHIIIGIVDRGSSQFYIAQNGILAGPSVSPAGSLASGSGLSLGASLTGTGFVGPGAAVVMASLQYGADIADKWLADSGRLIKEFTYQFSGLSRLQGEQGSFTRASAAAWENRNGIWSIASSGFPRAGDSEGLLLEPSRQNDCYNTVNPSVTTGWSVTGGTHTAGIDDSTALATADIGVFGDAVHRFVPGGSDQIIYGGAQTGNVNPRCIVVALRGSVGGESVDIGYRDVSAGTFQNTKTVVLTTDYQIITVENITPSDTDLQFGLDCDAGDTIYFISPHSEEGAVPTSIIPNWSTIAAAVRAMDDFVFAETPSSTEGAIEIDVEPVGWGGTDAGISPLLWTTAGGTAMLYVNAGGNWECDIDGTTQLDSGVSPVDGVRNVIKLRWNTGGLMSIDVDGTVVTGAYDGSLLAGGTWELAAGAPFKVRSFKTMRNG